MTVIPPITDPMGKFWEQPSLVDILVDDTHAVMTKRTFQQLRDYSRSQPTGAYQGKMWKAEKFEKVELADGRVFAKHTGEWNLCWFGPDPKDEPGYVGNYYRKILLID